MPILKIITGIITNFKSLHGFRGRCLEIRDVCTDLNHISRSTLKASYLVNYQSQHDQYQHDNPFLDYCDIVWGDRNNKLIMDSLQVLQNRAAKVVLDLKWKELRVRRRIHRLIYVFKCVNGLLDHNYNFTTNAPVHHYQTRHANDLRINRSRCGKGQLRSSYFLFKEWNEIPLDIRNSESVGIFKNVLHWLM